MTEGLKSTILSVRLYQIFNPLALRALPLYSLTETPRNAMGHGGGRGLKVAFQFRYKDSIVHFSPVRMVASHPAMLRGTAREDCDTKDFLSQSKKVLVTLIYVICSFFSAARRTNRSGCCFY